jgi:hypothetical protein
LSGARKFHGSKKKALYYLLKAIIKLITKAQRPGHVSSPCSTSSKTSLYQVNIEREPQKLERTGGVLWQLSSLPVVVVAVVVVVVLKNVADEARGGVGSHLF